MAGVMGEDFRPMLNTAALGVVGAKFDTSEPGEGYRGSAHRARLEGNVEVNTRQPGRAAFRSCDAYNQHLGMGGWVVILLNPVAGGGDHLVCSRVDQHRTDWHLTALGSGFSLIKGQGHIVLLGHAGTIGGKDRAVKASEHPRNSQSALVRFW